MRRIATSALTLLEVLILPYRAADLSLAERYEALLTRSRGSAGYRTVSAAFPEELSPGRIPA